MNPRVTELAVRSEATIRDTMVAIDRGRLGIALVLQTDGILLGTVTDGDVRRAILAGGSLDSRVDALLDRAARTRCITAAAGTNDHDLLRIMMEYDVRHVPLIDVDGQVVDVAFMGDLVKERSLPLQAVVMAGGFGRRLRPLTDDLPKPMLPIGGRPLLETTVDRLRRAGIRQCTLTTHYMGHTIRDHFGDGSEFGVEIGYVEETHPLGTAGALRLVEQGDDPLLVLNGDVLTGVDFGALFAFHREQDADLTLGVRPYEVAVPFGVVETDGARVVAIEEKPVLRRFINAGIYVVEPRARDLVPERGTFDMPDLVRRAIDADRIVASFPITEYWQDIGQVDDYRKAILDFEGGAVQDAVPVLDLVEPAP
ncbi:MAG: hypothetical protein CMJ83_08360 [Planctomycetes bacterium]|nr:hypothetical protein [Planctomycetota bacterium]